MKFDDLLDQPDAFEARLRTGVEHIAHADPISDPGPFDPDAMTVTFNDPPERRSPTRALAAAAAVVAAVGGLTVLATRDQSPAASNQPTQSPTRQPDDPFTPPTIGPSDTSPLPTTPQAVQDSVEADGVSDHAECEVLSAELERVATATDPYGGPDYEWWIAPTRGGGQSETVVQLDADGQIIGGGGGSLSCDPAPVVDIYWSGGGGKGEPNPMVSHGGQVSLEATAVILTFPGQPPVQVPVNRDGYFLTVLAEDPNGPFSYPERIDALDSTGAIVATLTP
jgi:hypothetical protein